MAMKMRLQATHNSGLLFGDLRRFVGLAVTAPSPGVLLRSFPHSTRTPLARRDISS